MDKLLKIKEQVLIHLPYLEEYNNPGDIGLLDFDIAEAVQLYKIDYNENAPLIHYFNTALLEAEYKSHSFTPIEDQEEDVKAIYEVIRDNATEFELILTR